MADREVTRSLSELPEEIIHEIVSYMRLTEKQAIRLSLLSKDFLSAVRSRRILVFDHSRNKNGYIEEINSLHSTLTMYHKENINLDMFSFDITGDPSDEDFRNECINLATRLSPKILSLRLFSNSSLDNVPQSVFGAASVTQLSLKDCVLRPEGMIMWPNLKRLRLEFVCMEDGVFEDMMKSSPLLENLQINCCNSRPFSLNFKHSCKNLRVLSLHSVITDDDFFTDFEHKFPRLEDLCVDINRDLQRISISSRSLKKIQLLKMHKLEEALFDAPNVVRFVFSSRFGVIPRLSFKGNSSGWISCIGFECKDNVYSSWFVKLNEFLAELNGSETSVTVSFKNGVSFCRPVAVSAQSAIKEFSLETIWPFFSRDSAEAIIHGIFWICRPQRITFAHFQDTRNHPGVKNPQEMPPTDQFLKLLEAHTNRNNETVTLECPRGCPDTPRKAKRLKIS